MAIFTLWKLFVLSSRELSGITAACFEQSIVGTGLGDGEFVSSGGNTESAVEGSGLSDSSGDGPSDSAKTGVAIGFGVVSLD